MQTVTVLQNYFSSPAEHRSWNMSRIRSTDTRPEAIVRKYLWNRGFRYRLHAKNLPGKPDIVFNRLRTAVFVNGCFWHQHPNCKRATMPKSNEKYWKDKLKNNVTRQNADIKRLEDLGWNVLTVWECQTKNTEDLTKILDARLKGGKI